MLLQRFGGREEPAGQHHVHHHGRSHDALDAHRAAAADEDAALAFGQAEEGALITHAHMRGHGQLQTSANNRTVQRADKGNRPARDQIEDFVPVVATTLARRLDLPRGTGQRFGEIEARAEVAAVAVQDRHIGFLVRPQHGGAQRIDHGFVDGVALVRAVEAQTGHLAIELVSDEVGAHAGFQRSISSSGDLEPLQQIIMRRLAALSSSVRTRSR